MLASRYLLATVKETPSDAELISHQYMLRAGLVRKLASGLYTWLPSGLKVYRKVEAIVRDEMNKAGALELLMPNIQPKELWQETDRWDQYGPTLLNMSDRNEREYCYGPTHEEVITDLMRKELKSYKQLPACFYQIQTKFRDEIRPRFGVMRAREFVMKDAYSFDIDPESLHETYLKMHQAYTNIFTRLGLKFRAVQADSGDIGGSDSHEFQVLAESGEDLVVYCPESDYAANIERAECLYEKANRAAPNEQCELTKTPGITSVPKQAEYLKLPTSKILKTLLVKGSTDENPVVALLIRGDDELNEVKAQNCPQVASPLEFISEADLLSIAKCQAGFVGPMALEVPIIADPLVMQMVDFSCGANQDDHHYVGVNWERDLPLPAHTTALRTVKSGDPSPDGKGPLKLMRGIEVGHIFNLGTKYSKAMNLNVLDQGGKSQHVHMGCFGIGVTRIVAAAIEQNHDDHGICWPAQMAPFQVAVLPMNYHKSQRVRDVAHEIHSRLEELGIEVILDDRKERPGIKFADMDLIGIPHRLIIGEKNLDNDHIEYKHRVHNDPKLIAQGDAIQFIIDALK